MFLSSAMVNLSKGALRLQALARTSLADPLRRPEKVSVLLSRYDRRNSPGGGGDNGSISARHDDIACKKLFPKLKRAIA